LKISEKQKLAEYLGEDCIINKGYERFGDSIKNSYKGNSDEIPEYKYAAKYDLFVPRLLNDIITAKNKGDISGERLLDTSNEKSEARLFWVEPLEQYKPFFASYGYLDEQTVMDNASLIIRGTFLEANEYLIEYYEEGAGEPMEISGAE